MAHGSAGACLWLWLISVSHLDQSLQVLCQFNLTLVYINSSNVEKIKPCKNMEKGIRVKSQSVARRLLITIATWAPCWAPADITPVEAKRGKWVSRYQLNDGQCRWTGQTRRTRGTGNKRTAVYPYVIISRCSCGCSCAFVCVYLLGRWEPMWQLVTSAERVTDSSFRPVGLLSTFECQVVQFGKYVNVQKHFSGNTDLHFMCIYMWTKQLLFSCISIICVLAEYF